MKIDLYQFIVALSDSIDLVGIDELHHGKRVALMALQCAKTLSYSPADQRQVFYLGLLHDCGVSSTRMHKNLINDFDWSNSHIHCEIGAKRLASFAPLSHLSQGVLYHHTPWSILQKNKYLPEKIKNMANLIFLLDRVDALTSTHNSSRWLIIKDDINKKIDEFRDDYFQDELVDTYLKNSEKESFWFTLEPTHLQNFLNNREVEKDDIILNSSQISQMAEMFAQIVDAKSPYTAEHSVGVAQLAKYLSKKASLSDRTCNMIEVAGLLHDLGKLQVPDSVLEKRGSLDSNDLSYMRHHSYLSYSILSKIDGLEEIAGWAANHHEALDGSGYPFHKTADDLDTESRIIIVSDIFQALAQDRPYRKAKPLKDILIHLKKQVHIGKLDGDIVALVEENSNECYQIAQNQL